MVFDNRRSYLFRHIQPAEQVGLEIGPYLNPTVRKDEGDVRYLDFYSKEEHAQRELERREEDAVIYEVDYVVKSDDYYNHVDRKFDYVIANHVIEHVDNPLQWVVDLFRLVEDDGVLFLTIPDKKYNFDRFRTDTSLAHLLADYFRGAGRPEEHGVELQMFYDTTYVGTPLDLDQKLGLEPLRAAYHEEPHPGRHNHVFQSETFKNGVLRPLQRMGVWPYTLLDYGPAPENYGEFYVVLRNRPEEISLTPEQFYGPIEPFDIPDPAIIAREENERDARREELRRLEERVEEAQQQLASVEIQLDHLRSSRLYRASKPLRKLLRAIRP